jgi:hypothetical protein
LEAAGLSFENGAIGTKTTGKRRTRNDKPKPPK